MTERFSVAAADWIAISAQILGWRPGEFWSATPKELALAMRPLDSAANTLAPSRELIDRMMEQDGHG